MRVSTLVSHLLHCGSTVSSKPHVFSSGRKRDASQMSSTVAHLARLSSLLGKKKKTNVCKYVLRCTNVDVQDLYKSDQQKDKSRKVFTLQHKTKEQTLGEESRQSLTSTSGEKGCSYPRVCSETSITIYLIRACSDWRFPLSGHAACVCVDVCPLFRPGLMPLATSLNRMWHLSSGQRLGCSSVQQRWARARQEIGSIGLGWKS